MFTGLYPFAPHLVLAAQRRRAKRVLPQPRVAAEWALAMAASAVRPLGFRGHWVGQGPRPIVLVHGYAMGRTSFSLLAWRMGTAGLGPMYGFEYWTLGKVSTAADRLSAFIDQVCLAHDCDQVDLVCHSMGGVVARYFVSLGGGQGRVRNLVTIGSPHQGTAVSSFGMGGPVRELMPQSALITRLRAAGLPPTVRALCIWSRGDALVWSASQARLPGATELCYDDIGHLGLLASRRVAAAIIEQLSE